MIIIISADVTIEMSGRFLLISSMMPIKVRRQIARLASFSWYSSISKVAYKKTPKIETGTPILINFGTGSLILRITKVKPG